MARSKKKRRRTKQEADVDEEVHVYDEPDPERDDYYQDDIDKFHADRDKILLDITAEQNQQGESDDDAVDDYQNEMMLLDVEESSDEDDSDDDLDHEEDQVNKEEDEGEDEEDESGSDIDSEKNLGKGIPSRTSWGRKKDAFYDADIAGKYAGFDEEMGKLAEEEEEEALALQQQMAASLEEQDFDTADFELPKTLQEKDDDVHQEKIVQDLSKLSKAAKIEILLKDSPELLSLLEEFKLKLKEVIEKLHPLVNIARAGKVPEQGANYLELKHQLYLNYCINIGFYLLLKAKQAPVRNHPVIARLVQYRKLIQELEPLDKKVEPELDLLLTGAMDTSAMEVADSKVQSVENKKKKRKRKRKRKLEQSLDSMDPLDYYEAVKLQKMKKKEAKQASVGVSDHLELHQEDIGKRGITYEMSKNKGLTAKRKKELRNPRVKHRKKFYKAQIKRKSQVRPVVNEQQRYGGEMTGIRSHLTRSVKIK